MANTQLMSFDVDEVHKKKLPTVMKERYDDQNISTDWSSFQVSTSREEHGAPLAQFASEEDIR